MNNFIVGQVTPTMIVHLGFGTFVFFGVCGICLLHPDVFKLLQQAFSFVGGIFVWLLVSSQLGTTKNS